MTTLRTLCISIDYRKKKYCIFLQRVKGRRQQRRFEGIQKRKEPAEPVAGARGSTPCTRRNVIREMGLEHETSFDGFLTPKRVIWRRRRLPHTACIPRQTSRERDRATRDAQETPNEGVPEHVRRRANGPGRCIQLVLVQYY